MSAWPASFAAVLDQRACNQAPPRQNKQFSPTGWINGLVLLPASRRQRRARPEACGSLRLVRPAESRDGSVNAGQHQPRAGAASPGRPCLLSSSARSALVQDVAASPLKQRVNDPSAKDPATMLRLGPLNPSSGPRAARCSAEHAAARTELLDRRQLLRRLGAALEMATAGCGFGLATQSAAGAAWKCLKPCCVQGGRLKVRLLEERLSLLARGRPTCWAQSLAAEPPRAPPARFHGRNRRAALPAVLHYASRPADKPHTTTSGVAPTGPNLRLLRPGPDAFAVP